MPLGSLWIDDERLTSLFGGNGAAPVLGLGKMGADEPWENVMDGESGPMLDLTLPCWDNGRSESLLIHDPFDEKESLGRSTGVDGPNASPCFKDGCRLLVEVGEVRCD